MTRNTLTEEQRIATIRWIESEATHEDMEIVKAIRRMIAAKNRIGASNDQSIR